MVRKLTERPKKREQEDGNQVDGDASVCEKESSNLRRFLLDILVLEKFQNRIQRFHFDHSKLLSWVKVHIRVTRRPACLDPDLKLQTICGC